VCNGAVGGRRAVNILWWQFVYAGGSDHDDDYCDVTDGEHDI